jgi:hypothetical protein
MRGFRIFLTAAAALGIAAGAQAQFGFGGLFNPRTARAEDFDGRFHYCRVVYPSAPDGDGGNWRTDYPRADINFSVRLSELTKTRISRTTTGDPTPLLIRLRDDALFKCPLVILSAPGAAFLDDVDAAGLRDYLLKGGMLWADDFWGSYQWDHWVVQLRKALPADQDEDDEEDEEQLQRPDARDESGGHEVSKPIGRINTRSLAPVRSSDMRRVALKSPAQGPM